jgi:hypothetical protein
MVTLPFYLSDRAADLLLTTLSVVYCMLSIVCCLLKQNQQKPTDKKLLSAVCCCLPSIVYCLLSAETKPTKTNKQKTAVCCLLLFTSPSCRQNSFKCLSRPTVSIPFVAGCSCLLYLSGHAADLLLTTITLLSIFVLVISSQPVSKLPAMQIWVLLLGAVLTKLSKLQVMDLMSSVLMVTLLLQLSNIPLKLFPRFHQLFYLVATPINTPDFRYLNHPHAPLPHPLRSPFNIQMYNNMWFSLRCHRVLF